MILSPYSSLVIVHALAGTLALISYWTAGFASKGSPLHRRVGRIYLQAMMFILATGFPMALIQLWQGNTVFGLFLLYLLGITSESGWTSLRAVRLKRQPADYFSRPYRRAAAALALSGLGILGFGLAQGATLLIGFSFIGLIRAMVMRRRARAPQAPLWAVREHYAAMIGNGVATHIAFLSIGLHRVLPASWADAAQLLAWFGPLAMSLVAGAYFGRRYAPRKARQSAAGATATA